MAACRIWTGSSFDYQRADVSGIAGTFQSTGIDNATAWYGVFVRIFESADYSVL